jgi:tetratricopeptide (TPR) repeat protein
MSDETPEIDPEIHITANPQITVTGKVGANAHISGVHIEHADHVTMQNVRVKRIPLDLPGRPEVLVGREVLVQEVLAALAPGKVVSLVGPGGVGKSALAAEVLWQLCQGKAEPPAAFPDGIVWNDFASQPEASAALTTIATAFGEDVKEAGGPAPAAKQALAGKTALLALDAAEACPNLDEVLELRAGCGVLLITRKKSQAGKISFEVPVLDETAGVRVLQEWGGEWADDEPALKRIVALTGGLSLALELAGKYLSANSQRAGEYLAWLEQSPLEALDHGSRERESVQVLLEGSLAALSAAGKAALGVFGLLGLGSVPVEAIADGMEVDANTARRALGELAGLGLARRVGELWAVGHALVHTYAAQKVAAPEGALERLVNGFAQMAFTANQTGYPADFAGLPVHVFALAERAEAARLQESGMLWNELGYHASQVGDYPNAYAFYRRALQNDEAAFGPEHPNVAVRINNLGLMLRELGELAEARAAFERALQIHEAASGPDSPDVARVVNNLGGVLWTLGDAQGAIAAYERALQIDSASVGPEHPDVAADINNLGLVYQDLGDLEGAKAAFERALQIDQASHGPEHPIVARDTNNLGGVLHALGDLTGAKAAYERARQIDEAVYGPEHPDVARDTNNLGLVLQDLGDLEGAKAAFERGLRIFENLLGAAHPTVATLANNLGMALQALGGLDGAKAAYERAQTISEAALGPGHRNIAKYLNNLGDVLLDQGDTTGAKAAFERALQIDEANYGPEHPNIAIYLNNLGRVLHTAGDLEGSRDAIAQALQIGEAALGGEHLHVGIMNASLAKTLQALGELEAARAAFERALGIFERGYPPGHENIQKVKEDLEEVEGEMKKGKSK